MKTFAILAAITLALSSVAVLAIQNVMASPTDPYRGAVPFSPGYLSQSTESPAKTYAPGQHNEHGTGESPTDPYKFAPGQQAVITPGPG